ncbi:MAG: glycosyltransferase 87 family protein [Pseudomonadota bacterium]
MDVSKQRGSPEAVLWLWLALAVLALFVAWLSGVNHDYSSYVQHWGLVLDAANPWAVEHEGEPIDFNAYGPGNLALAPAMLAGDIVPKLVLSLTALLIGLLISAEAASQGTVGRDGWLSPGLLFAASPLVAVYVYGFGSNDILAAFAVVLAFRARARERYLLVGAALAIGALVKFYPLLFVPFFAVSDTGRVRLRAFVSAVIVFIGGMAAAYLAWGESVLAPFLYAAEREPKMLSILRILDPVSARVGGEAVVDVLINYNSIIVVATAALFALYGTLARLDWRVTASTGILLTLMAYKVGHPHFYIVWLVGFAWLGVQAEPELRRLYTRAFAPLAIFLSAFSLLLLASGFTGQDWYLHGPWRIARPIGAGIFTLLALYGLWQARSVLLKPPTKGFSLSW